MIVVFYIKNKLNLSLIFFFRKSRREGGVFCFGNPDRRGVLVLQEIQVRGGVKKRPHPSGGGGGGVDFFWNNPFHVVVL